MSVLVIGESLVDVTEQPGEAERRTPGGGPLNIAVGMARLGETVSFLTDLGTDEDSDMLLEHLRESGVEVLARPRGASSVAHARLAPDGSAEYTFTMRWEPDTELTRGRTWDLVHFGSLGAFLAPGAASVDAAVAAHQSVAALRTFDPNIRPGLIGSSENARRRFEELARNADVVKLSDEDAQWLYPDSSTDEQFERLLQIGPGLVVLTKGGEGSELATARLRVEVDAPVVRVQDTIGAGDAYMAALADGLLSRGVDRAHLPDLGEEELQAIGACASTVSAIVVGRSGANPPWSSELG